MSLRERDMYITRGDGLIGLNIHDAPHHSCKMRATVS
jgi:hypothetical protein